MSFLSETDWEANICQILKNLGYREIGQQESIDIRNSIDEVLLISELKEYLKINYKNIDQNIIHEIIDKLISLKGCSLMVSNTQFQKYIVEGIKIKKKKNLSNELSIETYNLFLENSLFSFTRQYRVKSSHPNYEKQIPDIVIFINGIPIVVIELKSPQKVENDLQDAYQQIKNYWHYLNDLFILNGLVSK